MATKKEVKKHAAAIHTSGPLSLLERKLSNILLFNAYDDLLSRKYHKVRIPLLAEIAGYNSKDTGKLKTALKSLAGTLVEWNILKSDGGEKWGASTLLASVEFDNGICTYEYSGNLAKKLSEPEIYGRISLEIQKSFTSSYTLTIYEFCSRYKGILRKRNVAYTDWVDLELFKKMVGVDKVKSYEAFKELNRIVIKPSVDEINGTKRKYIGTDILITPEYKKVGRKIHDIRFIIEECPQTSLPIEKSEYDEIRKTDLYLKLVEMGINDKGAILTIQSNSTEYVLEKIALAEDTERQGKIKSSIAGYLKNAIDNDYQPPKKVKNDRDSKKKAIAKDLENKQAELDELNRREGKIGKILRREYIASLSEHDKEELLERLKSTKPKVIRNSIRGLDSAMISSEINGLIPNFDEKVQDLVKNNIK